MTWDLWDTESVRHNVGLLGHTESVTWGLWDTVSL